MLFKKRTQEEVNTLNKVLSDLELKQWFLILYWVFFNRKKFDILLDNILLGMYIYAAINSAKKG